MYRLFFIFLFSFSLPSFLFAQILFDDLGLGPAVQAPRNHVSLTCEYSGNHLIAAAKITPDWHLYSVTQPEGGTLPAVFTFENEELKLQEIRPTTAPHVNSNAIGFDVDIEEHDNSVTWVLTFQEPLPEGETIKGKLNGQVCQAGEGGMCIPISVPFEAQFNADVENDFKSDEFVKQLAAVPERFVKRFGDKTTPTPPKEGNEKDAPKERYNSPPSEGCPEGGVVSPFDVQETVNVTSFGTALLFAFLGGIILNVMPCVLPVIGLKILSFFEQAGKSRSRAFLLNVCYSLGLLSVFLLLAFLSLGLSILFTFDLFNIIMACVVFVMALSLMDIWTLSVPGILGGKASGQLTNQEGVLGAFFKGIVTTLLAIPCGAPLLSPAVNWADLQIRAGNMPQVFLMYSVIGLGMASPYLLLGAFPECLRFLPKPGMWMETFKKTMGFCLLLAVVWILFFIQMERLLPTVALLFALWFVCWLFGEQQLAGKVKFRNYIIAPMVLALVILFSYQIQGIPNVYTLESAMHTRLYGHQGEHWKPYTAAAFKSAQDSGKTVIVDFTADWCVNCKVLEATVLQSEEVLTAIDKKGIVSLTADCTREGESTELLLQLGPNQVPVVAIFDAANPAKPKVLRGFYTQKTLLELLN